MSEIRRSVHLETKANAVTNGTETMLTQCTHCEAVFNVSEEQLEVKRGLVRCGGCLKVFNAAWNLIEQDDSDAVTHSEDRAAPNEEAHVETHADGGDEKEIAASNELVMAAAAEEDQMQLGFDHVDEEDSTFEEASEFMDEVVETLSEHDGDEQEATDEPVQEAAELAAETEIDHDNNRDNLNDGREDGNNDPVLENVAGHIGLQATNDDYWDDDDEEGGSPILSASRHVESPEPFVETTGHTETQEIVLPGEEEPDVFEAKDDQYALSSARAVDDYYEEEGYDDVRSDRVTLESQSLFDDEPDAASIRKEPRLAPLTNQYDLHDETLAGEMEYDSPRADLHSADDISTSAHDDVYEREALRDDEYDHSDYDQPIRNDDFRDTHEPAETQAQKSYVIKDQEEEFDINKVDWVVMHGRSPAKIIAGVVALLLIVLLGVQARFVFLDELAQIDSLRPVLGQMCAATGCELPAKADVQKIDLAQTRIESHPGLPGALQISAELINRAEFPQPFPPLQLTLTDRLGHIVGRRSYPVDVYLADVNDARVLMPGTSNLVTLELADPNDEAVGFEVALLERL